MPATIKDIAREVGVSTTLVSFVMSNHKNGTKVYRVSPETEKRVLKAAQKLNYQPNPNARALRSGEARIIGVIISDIANKFYAEIARCVSDWASMNDYIALFGNTDEDASKLDQIIDIFESKGVEGFIIVPCEGSEKSILRLKRENKPFVLLDRNFPGMGASAVTLDNFDASSRMVSILARKGCRKLEMVSYRTTLSNIRAREDGFLAGVSEAGIESNGVHFPEYNNFEQVREIIASAQKRGTDGLLFATYRMALLGRRAMFELGYDRCKVACFNNNEEFDTYEKEIVYAKQPIESFASEALNILIRKMRQGDPNDNIILLKSEIITKG